MTPIRLMKRSVLNRYRDLANGSAICENRVSQSASFVAKHEAMCSASNEEAAKTKCYRFLSTDAKSGRAELHQMDIDPKKGYFLLKRLLKPPFFEACKQVQAA
eukprot:IDg9016t1